MQCKQVATSRHQTLYCILPSGHTGPCMAYLDTVQVALLEQYEAGRNAAQDERKRERWIVGDDVEPSEDVQPEPRCTVCGEPEHGWCAEWKRSEGKRV